MSLFQNFGWNPLEHSDEENLRWSWLRAVEWGIWPAFLSGPIVPLLLPFFEWWKVIGIVVVLTVLWSFIRYKYVNLTMASFGVYFVSLKWVVCPAVAIYLILQHGYILAALVVLWPALAGLFGTFVGGTRIGTIQEMFMNKLGYLKNKDGIQMKNMIDNKDKEILKFIKNNQPWINKQDICKHFDKDSIYVQSRLIILEDTRKILKNPDTGQVDSIQYGLTYLGDLAIGPWYKRWWHFVLYDKHNLFIILSLLVSILALIIALNKK